MRPVQADGRLLLAVCVRARRLLCCRFAWPATERCAGIQLQPHSASPHLTGGSPRRPRSLLVRTITSASYAAAVVIKLLPLLLLPSAPGGPWAVSLGGFIRICPSAAGSRGQRNMSGICNLHFEQSAWASRDTPCICARASERAREGRRRRSVFLKLHNHVGRGAGLRHWEKTGGRVGRLARAHADTDASYPYPRSLSLTHLPVCGLPWRASVVPTTTTTTTATAPVPATPLALSPCLHAPCSST